MPAVTSGFKPGNPRSVAVVDYGGESLAWVLDLPGCLGVGRDAAAAVAALPVATAEYAAWLREHGEDPTVDVSCTVVERVDAAAHTASGGEFLFAVDREPMSIEDLERGIALMGYARADLLAAVRELPDMLLDWEPPVEALTHADPWAPEARTIRGIVRHALQLELYYREALRDGPAPGIFERVREPAAERAATLARLRALAEDERSRVYRPMRPGRTTPDEWTVRKLIRRAVSHERAHAAEIAERRRWAQFGVPRRQA